MSTIKVFNKKDKDSIKVEIDGKRVTGIASLRIVAMANPPILVVQVRKNSAPPHGYSIPNSDGGYPRV